MTFRALARIMPLLGLSMVSLTTQADFQRGYVSMVGSSTVVPYAKASADRFAKGGRFHEALIQASGTGGALALFCESNGAEAPDVALASRAIKAREKDACSRNGIGEVVELKIGYDALILVQSRKVEPWSLTAKEARLAFAKWLAQPDGTMSLNPNHTWKDIRDTLPAEPIAILGPPITSSSYDAFIDLISELECKQAPWVPAGAKEATPDLLHKCRSVREDGIYREGDDEEHIAFIASARHPEVGVFGYKLLQEHLKDVHAIPVEGIEPTYANISSDTYPGSRPLYLYVKASAIGKTPGLREFLSEVVSEKSWGDNGYLRKAGLITLPASERDAIVSKLRSYGINPSLAPASDVAPSKPVQAKKGKSK
jgi:phosphate transport system substrate-binding protein